MSKKSRRMIGAGLSSLGNTLGSFAANYEPEAKTTSPKLDKVHQETKMQQPGETTGPAPVKAHIENAKMGMNTKRSIAKDPQEDLFNPNTPKTRWDMDI